MNMREEFEAWLIDFKSNAITKRFPNGEYVSAITENYFSVWQAALAAQAQQCSSLCHKDEPCSITVDGKCDLAAPEVNHD